MAGTRVNLGCRRLGMGHRTVDEAKGSGEDLNRGSIHSRGTDDGDGVKDEPARASPSYSFGFQTFHTLPARSGPTVRVDGNRYSVGGKVDSRPGGVDVTLDNETPPRQVVQTAREAHVGHDVVQARRRFIRRIQENLKRNHGPRRVVQGEGSTVELWTPRRQVSFPLDRVPPWATRDNRWFISIVDSGCNVRYIW